MCTENSRQYRVFGKLPNSCERLSLEFWRIFGTGELKPSGFAQARKCGKAFKQGGSQVGHVFGLCPISRQDNASDRRTTLENSAYSVGSDPRIPMIDD